MAAQVVKSVSYNGKEVQIVKDDTDGKPRYYYVIEGTYTSEWFPDQYTATQDARSHSMRLSDETTEDTQPPVKEKNSMDDQSKKIKGAGIEENPAGEVLGEEEPTAPEPKAKTAQELKENPHEALDSNGGAPDPLSVDYPANGEMLESMKNANADGDVVIKKDGQDVKNGGGYYEDSPPAIEDLKIKQKLSKNVDLDIFTKMGAAE